jgi:hypothetical protein
MADKEKLRASLERSIARFREAAAQLSDDQWNTLITGDEGWVARDVVGHLMTAERGMIFNAKRSAAGQTVTLPDDFDLDRYNQGQARKQADKSVAQLMSELEAVRAATLSFLDELNDEQMGLPTVHPVVKPITVAGIFKIIAIHQTQHAEELEKAAQKK